MNATSLLLLLCAGASTSYGQLPAGSNVGNAIPIYFGQQVSDIIDGGTRPIVVYSITLAQGQEVSFSTSLLGTGARDYCIALSAPHATSMESMRTRHCDQAAGEAAVLERTRIGLSTHSISYRVATTGRYFLTVKSFSASTNFSLHAEAKGTPISLPNPATAGCLAGPVNSITYSLQLIAAGLPDEVVIGGTRACNSCQVKPPLYPEISNRLENALRSRINVEACYDAEGKIFQIKLAQ